eukprot:jgi/Botrbrau1/7516/Bobra.0019s0007.1
MRCAKNCGRIDLVRVARGQAVCLVLHSKGMRVWGSFMGLFGAERERGMAVDTERVGVMRWDRADERRGRDEISRDSMRRGRATI